MILTAFSLRRNINTERDTYGYRLPAWGQISKLLPVSPILGCPIESPSTIRTNIIKMVEYYHRNQNPVIAERLCWKFGKDLYPYKVRHLSLGSVYMDKDILFLQNLKSIHDRLSGNSIHLASPVSYYFDTRVAPWYDTELYRYTSYLYQKYRNWIETFAYAQDSWDETDRFIRYFDDGLTESCSEAHFEQFVLPTPMIQDPYTMNNFARPLTTGGLAFERPLGNPFDTSEPHELVIHHPEKTLYSPREAHRAIRSLDQVAMQYTDVNLEYILSGMAVISVTEKYCVSRYRDVKFHNAETDIRWVVLIDVLDVLYQKTRDLRLFDDIRVTFEMSYGEEVLIEVYHLINNECLCAVHFDLAMISLCVPGLAVDAGPF